MSETGNFWKNRIIESGAADPQELAKGYNPDNWRFHPQIQRDALEDALDSIGVLQPVLFNRLSGKVIDGHLRIELAILKGQPLIPVNYVELTDDEEALALATLDAITEQAEPIPDKLAALLERTRAMTADRPGLGAMLERLRVEAGINGNGSAPPEPSAPTEIEADRLAKEYGVETGQVWALGRHRLVVGDSTDAKVIRAALDGKLAQAIITDPPYGMNLETKRRHGDSTPDFVRAKKNYPPVKGDSEEFDRNIIPLEASEEFWFGADYYVDTLPNFGKDGSWVVWNKRADGGNENMQGSMFELIWSKQKHRRELISLVWNGVLGHVKRLDGDEKYHPTLKPAKLIMHIIEQWCGEVICDPFVGSGTTIIACEQLGRIARTIEAEPNYCAASIKRWETLTGQKAQLTGQTPRRAAS